jgi:hypothetical protein
MKKYVKVYSFSVLDKIKEGEKVYCIDKEECTITLANLLSAEKLLDIIKDCEKDGIFDRYEFYYIEEGEAENGNL